MQPAESPRSPRSSTSNAAAWTALGLPPLVVLAAFLGGATQRWSEAVVVGAFALLLLARPPRFSLGPFLNTAALLFLALAAVAFLPARWFFMPAWRVALTNDFGVQLASTVSPQPWLTLDGLLLLIAGLAWIYYVATLDAHLRDVRQAARAFSGGIIALAGLCIYLHLTDRALPFWHNERSFGPFPNRNQTGDLFGISTLLVLACLQDDFRRGHRRWIIWLAGVGVLIAALILDFSRAGILILVLGSVAWLARLALHRWSGARIAVATSLLLVLFAGLLIFGGETIERFPLRLGSEGAVTSDFRWLIFRDAATMIQSSPWCGVGLGNFESVFALFRDVSRGETRSLHPESDWLWVAAEMGWPALVLIFAAAAVFVKRVFPLREGTNQRLRYAALVGALLFALHGFVDVSGHRFATFLAGTLLLGLAQFRPPPTAASRWPPILFRFVGLLLVVVSVAWLFSWRRALPVPGFTGVENAKEDAIVANRGHRFDEAIAFADCGLEWAPLDWQLYFIRATARIGARQPPARALEDFRRARFLEPSAYQLPYEEGKAWLGAQPILTLTAWREALQRQGAESARIYSRMLGDAADFDPAVLEGLRQYALDYPALTINYLESVHGARFEFALHEVLARDPGLKQFSSAQKTRLFALWSGEESRAGLLQAVETHPEWLEFAWPGIARYHAGRQEFEAAWQLVRQHAPEPSLPQAGNNESMPQLERKLYASANDYAAGYALFRAQMAAGKIDDALATARHCTGQAEAPPYFLFLQAEAWAATKNWERAWQSWEEYESAVLPK
ncbi:MAG TPA: O-antigen ligase family protein [Chthoniobacterales bacterium]|nr:O-antigen ligase family protein [Chthoniobacterales bacterium]